MSRIGKIPISLPKEAKVFIENGEVRFEGAKGKLSFRIPQGITVENKDNKLLIGRTRNNKQARADHGTVRARLWNMLVGVTKGHAKDLEIQGLGFRVQVQGKNLIATLGLSHPIEFPIPEGVKISAPKPTEIKVEGIDKVLVGQVAADIRDLKRSEPYKGKGIKYAGEVIRRKQGKAVSK